MKIEYFKPGDLKPYEKNPRINDAAVDAVAESLKEFGFRQPIVVSGGGVIVCGHTRWMAAQKIGLEKVPVHVIKNLTPEQIRAFRIIDNKTAELAEWDLGKLTDEINAIGDPEQFKKFGFSDEDLLKLFSADSANENAADAPAPEPPKKPATKPGDLYCLGRHRLLCGDSTNPADVARVLAGAKPFIMVTDPPYGVNYEPEWREGSASLGKVLNDDRAGWAGAYGLAPCLVAYVWHAGLWTGIVQRGLESAGFQVRSQIIWAKKSFPISRGDYHFAHEPCWYAVRKGAVGKFCGGRKQKTTWGNIIDAHQNRGEALYAALVDDDTVYAFPASATTVWELSRDKACGGGHSTQKPLECMARPIRNHRAAAAAGVYDPFLGSGTTLMAAETLGVPGFGLELSPAYCDVIVARWEKVTGHKAKKA